MKKLFIQTIFILSCFLFFLAFFSKSVNADTSCGGWCQGQVGHSDPPWCQCNRNTSDGGFNLHSCTTSGVYDCSTCCSFTQAAAPPPAAPPPAAPPSAPAGCSHNLSDAEAQCYLNRYPDLQAAFGANNIAAAKQHWLTYGCRENRDYSCGPSCGNTSGATDCTKAAPRLQTGHWYCHSLGNTYDCMGNGGCLRCSTGTDVCPGSPPPLPACSCSTSYGACNVGCSVGQKQRIVSCNRGGCGEGTWCVADAACNPTCTVSLSPSSLKLQIGDSELLTANVSVQNGSVSRVNFTSVNSTIASLDPSYRSSSPYTVAVYGNSVGSTTITAQALLSPSGSCSTPTSVPVSVEAKSWFQTQGGDIYTGGSLSDKIPETATDRNLSLELDNWPGVIAHQDTNGVDLGSGFSSLNTPNNWLSLSEYQGKIYGSFQFFKKKFATQMATENYSSGNGTNAPSEDKVYYAKSSRILNGNWSLGNNRWIVLLVEGDVSINTDIIVPKGSFLAIAATGSIVFNSSVTKAQGMFVADNRIDTSSGAIAFEGQGTFTAPQVILGRDFKDSRNQATPVESFVARPDFIMSSYKDADHNLWYFNFLWKELAP